MLLAEARLVPTKSLAGFKGWLAKALELMSVVARSWRARREIAWTKSIGQDHVLRSSRLQDSLECLGTQAPEVFWIMAL